MSSSLPVPSLRRRLRGVALAGALAGLATGAGAAAPAAPVAAVATHRVADLVLLRGGFDAGLRQGMVCRITRGSAEIAEVLLVELRPASAAALILSVAPRQSIRSGDLATSKILKS